MKRLLHRGKRRHAPDESLPGELQPTFGQQGPPLPPKAGATPAGPSAARSTRQQPQNSARDDAETNERIDGAFRAYGEASMTRTPSTRRPARSAGLLSAAAGVTGMASAALASNAQHPSTNAQSGVKDGIQIPAASLAVTAYDNEAIKKVRDRVNTLLEGLPGLVRALDEVGRVHPFIGVAVGAFRVVIELNIKRQDNDQKIGLLFLQMKDMMESLLQLRQIRDEDSKGPGGITIKARMQELVKQAAEDIKQCANVCDTYAKKRPIVKVVMSSVWDGKLKEFIDIFVNRRRDFIFALTLHTSKGVDDANRKIEKLDMKIDVLLEFFNTAVSQEQQELSVVVQKKGGPRAVLSNDETLKDLLNFKPGYDSTVSKRADDDGPVPGGQLSGENLAVVKQELFDSPEVAIRKNFEVFERKFLMQQRELEEEFRRIVHHEGDRIIAAVNAGVHDRIIDPEIHEIWKEMRWPGHVKARHFVLALRDYYRQQIDKKRKANKDLSQWLPNTRGRQFIITLRGRVEDFTKRKVNDGITRVSDQDEWAMEYLNINKLQALAEAFDDDASGFVTIGEVNEFTSSRPKGWSLPHWLAYWAIGWQMTTTYYRDAIMVICAKMFSATSSVLPENRHLVDKYLETVWKPVCTLTSSFTPTYQPDALRERFKAYVESEENRLRDGLETIKYRIDALDTLSLVTGSGRIEMHLMPLLYLLLSRDLEILRLSRKTPIDVEELRDSAASIQCLLDAVTERHDDLEALFLQQRLDPAHQFQSFASELFDLWHDSTQFWSVDNLRNVEFLEVEYDPDADGPLPDPDAILNYPPPLGSAYPADEDDGYTSADEAVQRILGQWNGFMGMPDQWPSGPMVTFSFEPSALSPSGYEANAVAARGTKYAIVGEYTVSEDSPTVIYTFSQTYSFSGRPGKTTYFSGTLSEDGLMLSGAYGLGEDDRQWPFLFTRLPATTLAARPPPEEFNRDRIRALWKFALAATLVECRRQLFSWSYLKERRDARKAYLALLQRETEGTLTAADFDKFTSLDRTLTYDDARCYYVLEECRQRRLEKYSDTTCDVCESKLYETRMVCMDCSSRTTLNFCDKRECFDQVIKTPREDITHPHLPTHDLVRIRSDFHYSRDIGKVLRLAESGLERARVLVEDRTVAQGKGKKPQAKVPEKKTVGRREKWLAESAVFDTDGHAGPLECVSCHALVSYPCWYCIDCPENANVFLCVSCDEKGGVDAGEHHRASHNLVRCTEKGKEVEAVKSTEERLAALETQLTALSSQIDQVLRLVAAGRR